MPVQGREAKRLRRVVGQRLRGARLVAELNQRQAADKARITQASISNYELGTRDVPFFVVFRLCTAYHVPIATFVELIERDVDGG